MLSVIRQRQAKYAALFNGHGWAEDELSDLGWLGLIGVPWLLEKVQNNGQNNGRNRDSDSHPGAHSVRSPEPALQFVLPEQAMPAPSLVVITGYPLAKFLVGFFAKVVGVSFVVHVVERSTVMDIANHCGISWKTCHKNNATTPTSTHEVAHIKIATNPAS